MDVLWVGVGGFAGAIARYALTVWVASHVTGVLPFGTFVVNVTGSFALGVIAGAAEARAIAPVVRPLVSIGFLGAYTTFSTFSYETLRLAELRGPGAAAANVVASVGVGLAATLAGLALGRHA